MPPASTSARRASWFGRHVRICTTPPTASAPYRSLPICSFQHFDAIDRHLRNFVPYTHPPNASFNGTPSVSTSEPACAGAANAAQRNTLCRRIRHSRGCSTEQSEARNHLERVIERQRGAGQQFDCRDNRHCVTVDPPRQVSARRRDVHGFKERRRLQHYLQVARVE